MENITTLRLEMSWGIWVPIWKWVDSDGVNL